MGMIESFNGVVREGMKEIGGFREMMDEYNANIIKKSNELTTNAATFHPQQQSPESAQLLSQAMSLQHQI